MDFSSGFQQPSEAAAVYAAKSSTETSAGKAAPTGGAGMGLFSVAGGSRRCAVAKAVGLVLGWISGFVLLVSLPVAATRVGDILDGLPNQQVDLRALLDLSTRALLSLSWAALAIYTLALTLLSAHVLLSRGKNKTREAALFYMSIAAPLLMVLAVLVQLLAVHVGALWGEDVEKAVEAATDSGTLDNRSGELYVPPLFQAVSGLPGKLSFWRSALITSSLAAFGLPLLALLGGSRLETPGADSKGSHRHVMLPESSSPTV